MNEGNGNIFRLSDLAEMYKLRVIELGGHTLERVQTTKLKTRLMSHMEELKRV